MNGLSGLQDLSDISGDKQKFADVLDSISNAVRGESSGGSWLCRPIAFEKVVLVGVVGFLGYKLIELAVRGRN